MNIVKGKLLIAEPSILNDDSFNRSIILLTEHNEESSVGFILNKPLNYTIRDLIPEINCSFKIYQGGPVEQDNLYFILGSDTAMNIRTWNNYGKLSELTNFLIALRKEDSVNNLNENFPFDYELIDGEKLDLSSTSLRNKLKDNLFNEEEISLKIIQYIMKNSLY